MISSILQKNQSAFKNKDLMAHSDTLKQNSYYWWPVVVDKPTRKVIGRITRAEKKIKVNYLVNITK